MRENFYSFINSLKLEQIKEAKLKVNFYQLKQIYDFFELNTYHYEYIKSIYKNSVEKLFVSYFNISKNSESEQVTWFANIKNTYELLDKYSDEELKNITIYFEYEIDYTIPYNKQIINLNHTQEKYPKETINIHKRIDTIIQNNNSFLIIEYSHINKENENYLIIQKTKQVREYMLYFILQNFNTILGVNSNTPFYIEQTIYINNLSYTIENTNQKINNLIQQNNFFFTNKILKKITETLNNIQTNLFFLEEAKELKAIKLNKKANSEIILIRKLFLFNDEAYYFDVFNHDIYNENYLTTHNNEIFKVNNGECTEQEYIESLKVLYPYVINYLLLSSIFNNQ